MLLSNIKAASLKIASLKNTARFLLVVPAAILCLSNGLEGMILCLGPGGHAHLESSATGDCCASTVFSARHEHSAEAILALKAGPGACHGCVDLSLSPDPLAGMPTAAGRSGAARASAAVAALRSLRELKGAPNVSRSRALQPPSRTLLAVRSAILLL